MAFLPQRQGAGFTLGRKDVPGVWGRRPPCTIRFGDMCGESVKKRRSGRRFNRPGNPHKNPKGLKAEEVDGGVAQLGEHLPCTQGVSGSRRSKLRSAPNPLSALRTGDSSHRSVAPPYPHKAALCGEVLGKGYVGS